MVEADVTQVLKTLANPTRRAILRYLRDATVDQCVYQIAEAVDISPSMASHQLAHLSARSLVVGYREGQTTCYRLAETVMAKQALAIISLF